MRVRVLGSGAGGGFPQWNCNCRNCAGFRSGQIRATARTQSSIAVSDVTAETYVLLNASPDVGAQLKAWPASQPGRFIRDTAIAGVILVDSQIDHCTGLLSLRENKKLQIYCTDPVFEDLSTQLPVFSILASYVAVERRPICIEPSKDWMVDGVEHLRFKALPVKGKAPPYSPRRENGVVGDNIAIEITDLQNNKTLLYAPGIEVFDSSFHEAAKHADCVMVDGTFWTDDEMNLAGISTKKAKEMGHLCLSGKGGMIDRLETLAGKRRILIHINNTNPILDLDSKEKRILDDLGIEVAFDGMEFDL